jgi:hypothetical protein
MGTCLVGYPLKDRLARHASKFMYLADSIYEFKVSFSAQGNRSVPFSIVIDDSFSRNSGVQVVLVDRSSGVCMCLVILTLT